MDAGNFMSPEAVIVLPLAIILDAVGIILVVFALDDFFITDAIGWATLGIWSAFRSQVRGSPEIEIPDRKKMKEQAQQLKQASNEIKTTKITKAAKWTKWIRFLEFVPYLGAAPFWTISTFFILKGE